MIHHTDIYPHASLHIRYTPTFIYTYYHVVSDDEIHTSGGAVDRGGATDGDGPGVVGFPCSRIQHIYTYTAISI